MQTTHQDASQAIAGIAQAHQGASTQVMNSRWSTMSSEHVSELVTGCAVLADALDVAAGYIVVQKGEAIATLIGMAVAFVADQAAAFATLGASEAALPLIIDAAEQIVKSLVMDLEQYVIGQVIEAAAKPLFAKIESALTGLDWSQSSGGSGAVKSTGFSLDVGTARSHTAALRTHADTIRGHAQTFQEGVRGLGF